MQKFYIQLFFISFFCGALLFISDFIGYTHIGFIGWLSLAFFIGMTVILMHSALKSISKSGSRFISGVMGRVGLRMLLCILFVVIYWVMAKERDTNFILYFFILYLFFTVFEIMFLLPKLRTDKKDDLES